MTKARENRLWDWLKKAKPHFRDKLVMSRVENMLMKGMADVTGGLLGCGFWIELKSAARPTKAGTKVSVKFQPGQSDWLKKWAKSGLPVYLLVQVGSGHKAQRYLISGSFAHRVEAGVPEYQLADLAEVPPDTPAVDMLRYIAQSPWN